MKKYYLIKNKLSMKKNIQNFLSSNKLAFLEVKISNSKIKKASKANRFNKNKKSIYEIND